MRFRRHRRSSGRREPFFWSRACAQTFHGHAHTDSELDCESSESEFGVVLFDASAAQLNSAEGRVTVHKIHYPMDLQYRLSPNALQPDMSIWEMVVKTQADPANLNGQTLSTLLGQEDVVNLRMFGARSGAGAVIPDGNTLQLAMQVPSEATVNVKRKLDVTEKIVALYGLLTHNGATDAFDSIWSINLVISVLWSRTLR